MKRTNRTYQEIKAKDTNNIIEDLGTNHRCAARQATAMGRILWSCKDRYFIVNNVEKVSYVGTMGVI